MTRAEKFREIFGIEADEDCCPLPCVDCRGGLDCFKCPNKNWFKEEYIEQEEKLFRQ